MSKLDTAVADAQKIAALVQIASPVTGELIALGEVTAQGIAAIVGHFQNRTSNTLVSPVTIEEVMAKLAAAEAAITPIEETAKAELAHGSPIPGLGVQIGTFIGNDPGDETT